MARIALFGGSFDPPHLGHVFAAIHARIVGLVDEVWVLPVANHPYGKQLSPWQQRLNLLNAAFADFPFVRIREDEQANPQGHTFSLVESLQQDYPQHQWILVGGTDTYDDLVNWYRGAELQRIVQVHAVPRRGFDNTSTAALPQVASSDIRQRLAQQKSVENMLPARVIELISSNSWYSSP